MNLWKVVCVMNDFINNRFKDCNPHDTITTYRKILEDIGFEISQEIQLFGSIYLTRIIDRKTGFFSYGKGLNVELSIASALGEFLERNAFGMLASYPFFYYSYFDKHKDIIEFISLTQNKSLKVERFETFVKYRSTGMASGNTFREAFVQACSEVFERYVECMLFKKKFECVCYEYDDIVEDIGIDERLKSLIIDFKNEKTKIYIIDVATETGLPVVGVIISDENIKKYAFRFASHPVFVQAIEACILEFAQMQSYDNIFKYMGVDWYDESNDEYNLHELLTNGRGKFPISYFVNNTTKEKYIIPSCFRCSSGVSNNSQFYKHCRMLLKMKKWMIYYRVVEFSGAVCIQVIIPGVSDIYAKTIDKEIIKRKIADYSSKYIKKQISLNLFLGKIFKIINTLIDENNKDYDYYRRCGIFNSNKDLKKLFYCVNKLSVEGDFINSGNLYIYHEFLKKNIIRNFVPIEDGNYKSGFELEEKIYKYARLLNL